MRKMSLLSLSFAAVISLTLTSVTTHVYAQDPNPPGSPAWCADHCKPEPQFNQCNQSSTYNSPECCVELHDTGDPFACSWPDRGYCLDSQCSTIPAGEDRQRCGGPKHSWCDLCSQNHCPGYGGAAPSNTPIPTTTGPAASPTTDPSTAPTATTRPTPYPTCALRGDVDCDGIVDENDYRIWRREIRKQTGNLQADLNQDSVVDVIDYEIMRSASPICLAPAHTPTPNPTGTTPSVSPTSGPSPTPDTSLSWDDRYKIAAGDRFPHVAVDVSGVGHYVWGDKGGGQIWYRTCGQSLSSCSAPVALSASGANSFYPTIDTDGSGDVVVWETQTSGGYDVYFTKTNGQGWTIPQKISHEQKSELPQIVKSSGGAYHVVYQSKSADGIGSIHYTFSSDGGATWSPSARLGAGLYPRLAMGTTGVLYIIFNTGEPYKVYAMSKPQGGAWGEPQLIAQGERAQTPDVAVGPDGNVHVVWSQSSDGVDNQVRHRLLSSSLGLLGTEEILYPGSAHAMRPQIAVDNSSIPHVVAQVKINASDSWIVRYTKKLSSGWSPPASVSAGNGDMQTPSISIGATLGSVFYMTPTEVWTAWFTP